MAALVLAQVPDADVAAPITGDEFALVWVDYDIVYRHAVGIVSLDVAAPCVPDLDGPYIEVSAIEFERVLSSLTILGARDHPFAFAMKSNTRDVPGVALKCEDRRRIGRLDVIKLDCVVSRGCEISFVG